MKKIFYVLAAAAFTFALGAVYTGSAFAGQSGHPAPYDTFETMGVFPLAYSTAPAPAVEGSVLVSAGDPAAYDTFETSGVFPLAYNTGHAQAVEGSAAGGIREAAPAGPLYNGTTDFVGLDNEISL